MVLSVVGGGAFATAAVAQDSQPTADGDGSATPIHDGETISVTTNGTEEFTFNATRGEAFGLAAKIDENTSQYNNVALSVYDENGTEVGELTTGDFPMRTEVASGHYTAEAADVAPSTQTYTVRVTKSGDERVHYDLTLEQKRFDEYDPNESPETATEVDANATIEAASAEYDEDNYAVNLTRGDEMTVDVTSDGWERFWYDNGYVITPSGEEIGIPPTDAERPTDSATLRFEANETGTYVVHWEYSAENTSDTFVPEPYAIDLTHTPDDEVTDPFEDPEESPSDPDDGEDTGPEKNLPDEEVRTYSVTTNTTETFTFDATSGEAFAVVATLDENTSDYQDVAVTVTDENGNETANVPGGQPNDVTETVTGDRTAKAADVAEANRTYTVEVQAIGDEQRQYNLTIGTEQPDQYDPNEDVGAATAVDANATVDAVAASYDDDNYAVNLTAGDEMELDVISNASDRHWYERVTVTAPNGESVYVDDYKPSFEAKQNGTYVVSVTFGPRAAEDADLSLEAYTLELDHMPDDTIDNPEDDDPEPVPPENGTDDGDDSDDPTCPA
ncbi:hypothetical protein [Haloarcula nitratireducens]|uniref:Cell surface glycoprotein n=1 Tax=Haloarcula nitratireducens TaxID=2487749 RepID=A0AAW4P733_9EURY|nr:hypothetical protein [Halomicroarcula nitratireducens]MBX0293669.1 hypothetical protein [Halomicroarcula nitratireducens]